MTKNDLNIILAFFCFSLGLLIFTFYTPNYYSSKKPVNINIRNGATFNEVIEQLYSKKIIHNKTYLRLAALIYGAEDKIKAGEYKIPNGLSYFGLIDYLTKSPLSNQILVTIPEGIWLPDLAKLFKNKLHLDSAKFMALCYDNSFIKKLGVDTDNLEGYLLPNTYYFYKNSTEENVIIKLTNEMKLLFTPEILKRCKELNMSEKEILILASIIDGESNKISEFNRISGVYHNRLKINMSLQADPTIQYLVRDQRPKRILNKFLEIVSPFNTYLYTGLPPAPINNPGKEAIMAALYPENHNYLYFVANGKGEHRFAKTLTEHNANVVLYKKAMDTIK